jgi:hypothetical protein
VDSGAIYEGKFLAVVKPKEHSRHEVIGSVLLGADNKLCERTP